MSREKLLVLITAISAVLIYFFPRDFAIVFFLGYSFLVTTTILPFYIYRMKLRGLIGKDMNKFSRPEVPELGGITVLFGFIFSVLLAIFFHSYLSFFPNMNLTALLAGTMTIFLIALLGLLDDLIGWKQGIRQYQHALVPVLAALPLMALPQVIGYTSINLPIFGIVHLGILYPLLLVPIAVTGASNATNMLAGLNGLEAGLGIINTITLFLIAIILGETEVMILMAGTLGALIAFHRYNKFPARIFPGDSLTLMVGASLAVAAIIGNMEKPAVALFALFFIELILKGRSKMQAESFGIPQEDGTLKAPEKIRSLTHWIIKQGKFTEKQVVARILLMQAVLAVIVFIGFYLNFLIDH